jgi:S-adenosylmethionine/arginine decarboxylase-like enzyme
MVGRAYLSNPAVTEQDASDWLLDLVNTIDMKILMGPYTINCETLGNEGVTGAVVIETSHCSGHFWHRVEKPFLMFDVYSCVDFDPNAVLENLHKHFQVIECSYAVIDRNQNINVLTNEMWYPSE